MPAEVQSYGDVAVTPHVLATGAAMECYAWGGNAVDAAVAANAVQGVVAPETCGVGGDLFALIWVEGGVSPEALNASGPAGSGADAASLRAQGMRDLTPFHPQTITIPGCVAGWEMLLERYGTLQLEAVLSPALRLAEQGFPASNELARAFAARADELASQDSASEMYPSRRPPGPRERVVRPRLADTLRQIGAQGSEAFYRGDIATAIVKATSEQITLADLGRYRPTWVEPLQLEVFGQTAWTIPPNSQGYLTLAAAHVFERLHPPPDSDDPLWHHLLIEAYRAVAWDRDRVLADPARSHVPYPLDPDTLTQRATAIDPNAALDWPSPSPALGGTAYLATVDRNGMAVSLIQSNYWGIGSNVGAAGFFLHNRGYGFTLEEGHPNELAPGKRPAHTLSPTLWTKEARLAGVLGTRGGNQQPQILVQLAARLFGLGWEPGAAQAAPRWILDDLGKDRRVKVEPSVPRPVIEGLEARGHHVEVAGEMMGGWGPVSVIRIGSDGLRTAAPDPRIDTAAAAVR